MVSKATNPEQYIEELPDDRKLAMSRLREIILKNIPAGFEEQMSYGMLGYVVPKSIYPAGYHCNPKLPLPFLNLGSQKNFIALYHLAIYGNKDLYDWFTGEYEKIFGKLDAGKGCLRFKNMDKIPFELIGELCSKITVDQWITYYETVYKNKNK
jgi:uncharacterized protein YdhG (YjbR/CyaY superfamily)